MTAIAVAVLGACSGGKISSTSSEPNSDSNPEPSKGGETDSCEGCTIDDVCYPEGTPDPSSECQACRPDKSTSKWSSLADGTVCDDGLFCNGTDSCQDGQCEATGTEPCGDGVSCNGAESCSETAQTCAATAPTCDDGALCNLETDSCEVTCAGCAVGGICYPSGALNPGNGCESCLPEQSRSSFSPLEDGAFCDDGLFCNGTDSCQEGTCTAPETNPCGDGVSCNGDEVCDEENNACSAGSPTCSAGTFCSPATDTCALTCAGCLVDDICHADGALNPLNACETCDIEESTTAFSAVADGASCTDGTFCNGTDSCQSGTCTPEGSNPCDDSVSCNGTESCNEETNSCGPGTATCGAGTFCDTGSDSCELTCDGCLIGGSCYADGAVNPLNTCEACDVATTATAFSDLANGTLCSDGAFCNGMDSCQAGTCTSAGKNPCDDSVSCNGTESCNETSDACLPGTSSCGDGTYCDASADSCEATCAGCLVGGVCYSPDAVSTGNACQICDTDQSTTAFVNATDDAACGYNAACTGGTCGCESGWVQVDGYCSLAAISADDETWTGTVYTGLVATIPTVNLLSNDTNNQGEDSELRIVAVKDANNGTVILDGNNIKFTGTDPGAGSFTYVVQAGSDTSTQTEVVVDLTVTAAPAVIALDDSFSVQQGETLPIGATSLLSNDVGSNLTVTAVSSPVGGTVSLSGTTISFESTGVSGEPAQFTYTVEDNAAQSSSGTVFITATPLPPLNGYLFEDLATFDAFRTTYSPPTVLGIFNTWGRFDGNTYWADGTLATGTAATWTLIADEDGDLNIDGDLDGDTVDDNQTSFTSGSYTVNGDIDGDGAFDPRFMQTNNGGYNGFVSPDTYDEYTHEVTLWSLDGDDDMVGVMLAYDTGGGSGALYVARTKGGYTPPSLGWGLIDGYTPLVNLSVDGVSGGWSGAASRVKVVRQDDLIQIYCTPWMTDASSFFSPLAYDPDSLIEIDLSSTTDNIRYVSGAVEQLVSRDLTRYRGAKSYGYVNESQARSSYIDVRFEGSIVSDVLVYMKTESPANIFNASEVWRYSGGSWALTGESVQDVFGFVRTVTEPSTGNEFIIRRNEVEWANP